MKCLVGLFMRAQLSYDFYRLECTLLITGGGGECNSEARPFQVEGDEWMDKGDGFGDFSFCFFIVLLVSSIKYLKMRLQYRRLSSLVAWLSLRNNGRISGDKKYGRVHRGGFRWA